MSTPDAAVASASTPARSDEGPFRRFRCCWHPDRELVTCPDAMGDSAQVRCGQSQGWTRKRSGRSRTSHWRCPDCTAEYFSPWNPPQRPSDPEPCCVANHGAQDALWCAAQCRRCGIEACASASTPVPDRGPAPSASTASSSSLVGSAVTPVPDLGRAIEERFGSFQQRLAEADRATEERFGGFQQRLRRLELTEKNNQEQLIQPLIERVAALETENTWLKGQASWLQAQQRQAWHASWQESGW